MAHNQNPSNGQIAYASAGTCRKLVLSAEFQTIWETKGFSEVLHEAWAAADDGIGCCLGFVEGSPMGDLKKQFFAGLSPDQQEIFRQIEVMYEQVKTAIHLYTADYVYAFATKHDNPAIEKEIHDEQTRVQY